MKDVSCYSNPALEVPEEDELLFDESTVTGFLNARVATFFNNMEVIEDMIVSGPGKEEEETDFHNDNDNDNNRSFMTTATKSRRGLSSRLSDIYEMSTCSLVVEEEEEEGGWRKFGRTNGGVLQGSIEYLFPQC